MGAEKLERRLLEKAIPHNDIADSGIINGNDYGVDGLGR